MYLYHLSYIVESENIDNMKHNIKNNDGQVLQSIVREAIETIRNLSFNIVTTSKKAYDPEKQDDIFTNADIRAQEHYVTQITTHFPGYGIIAEENELILPCTLTDKKAYFTIDPVDGTKAFRRKQSNGIGTMLSLIEDGVIIAAYVGNVTTGEIYACNPGSTEVERHMYGKIHILTVEEKPLIDQYLLLRWKVEKLSPFGRQVAQAPDSTALFRSYEIEGGSIGISMARLWKQEVAAVILEPGYETPWDICPLLGMNKALGIVCYRIIGRELIEIDIPVPTEIFNRTYEAIFTYRHNETEIKKWIHEHYIDQTH